MPFTYGGIGSNTTADSVTEASSGVDMVQTLLGVGGMIPEVGAAFNGLNTVIDVARGKWGRAALDGGLTLASVIPGAVVGIR